jgi:RNA 3'-terminal phosphate cyclase (ATP)
VWLSKLPSHIAERELAVVREALGWAAEDCAVEAVEHPRGPGNVVVLEIEAEVPVDESLADQLLLPMALAGESSFRTTKPSLHTTTNAAIIQRFLSVPIRFEQENHLVWRVSIGKG